MVVDVILILHVVLFDEDLGVVEIELDNLEVVLVEVLYAFEQLGEVSDDGWRNCL